MTLIFITFAHTTQPERSILTRNRILHLCSFKRGIWCFDNKHTNAFKLSPVAVVPQFVQQKDQLYADLEKGRPSRTPNHADHNFRIQDYTLFRRDRSGRRGGGVAVYVSNRLSADVWSCPSDSAQFELLWTRVLSHGRYMFVGGIYYPPKPLYRMPALLDCIEASVDALTVEYPNATIVLAGDFNGLGDAELSTRSMLTAIVNQPTRGTNVLDKIYVNGASYDAVKVVIPTVRSDHKAVIACTCAPPRQLNKTRERRVFRRRSPSQHALFFTARTSRNL